MAALGCVGLLSLADFTPQVRARRSSVSRALAPGCGSSGESSVALYGGGKVVSETDLPLCVTGHVTVTFAGDPASGCANNGLCGYAGTETWTPQNVGDVVISTFEQHGRRYRTATMVLGGFGSPVLSAVQRSHASGSTTACSDNSQDANGFLSVPVSGTRVTISLGRPEFGPLFGTRCAGPLDADVRAALPSRTVSLNRILHGGATVGLTGSGRFAAHGLAGTVSSTIVLALGRPHRSSGPGGSSPPPGVKRSRLAEVNYRVTRVKGSAIASVRSSTVAAVCGPFDACGLNGVINLVPGTTSGGSVYLTATAPLRRPKRDLLAALGVSGGNPSGIGVQGGGDASLRGEVTADLTQESACRDQVGLRQAGIELRQRAHRLETSVSPAPSQAAQPLRTRCPGPELGSHQLTSASVPLSALRRPSFTVSLHGGSFSDGPYRVTTRSTLTLTFRRAGVKTQIVPFVARAG